MLMLGAPLGHPLAPLVVRHKRKGKDDKDEDGESELHKRQEAGNRDQGVKSALAPEFLA
jgi:hypothetical protein